MKNLFRSFSILALLAGCFALTSIAQKPTLVRNQDEPGRTPYQQTYFIQQSNSTCATDQGCTVLFPAVPQGYRLVVTHVSAMFKLASGGSGAYTSLYANTLIATGQVFLSASVLSGTAYITSSPVKFYIDGGDSPILSMQGNNVDRTGYGA